MPINVSTETIINRACPEVSAYAFEPLNDPLWIGGIFSAVLLTERPIGLGAKVQRQAKFMGKTIDYILRVEEFEKGRKMVMNSIKSPFPMRVTYSFDPVGNNQTLARIRVEGGPNGIFRFFDFITAPMVRKNISKDIKKLKGILENQS